LGVGWCLNGNRDPDDSFLLINQKDGYQDAIAWCMTAAVGDVNSNWSIRDFFFMSKKGIFLYTPTLDTLGLQIPSNKKALSQIGSSQLMNCIRTTLPP
jgi:hypothetical protein